MKARTLGCAIAIATAVLGGTAPATAATHWVAVNGLDNAACGSQQSPCRSISQAIANAASGDTINVGPGHYGDVNGDGNFTGPGDEQPDPNAPVGDFDPSIQGCIVCITKPLHIYSLQGAATTVIASVPGAPYGSTVMIETDGVDFGAPGKGFTIEGGSNNGVTIALGGYLYLLNMSVQGNIDLGDKIGFAFYGYPDSAKTVICFISPGTGDCRFAAQVLVAGNQAINNQIGVNIIPNNCCIFGGGQIIVRDNVALGAGTGFGVAPGMGSSAGNVQLLNNVATGGGVGYAAILSGDIKYNTALSNSIAGFQLTPGGAAFFNNSAIANGGPGVIVDYGVGPLQPSYYPGVTLNTFTPFAGNNFGGNDRARPVLSLGPGGINPGPSAHCGVLSGIFLPVGFPLNPPPPAIQLLAANNYWGSANGPSSSGPGDALGGSCGQNNTTTVAVPFSKTPFSVGLQIPANVKVLYCARGGNAYEVGAPSNTISSDVSPNASGSPSTCAVPASEPSSWYIRTTTDGGVTWHWVYTLSQLGIGQ